MNQERLEALLLSIEHDLINTIDSDIIIDKFKIEITRHMSDRCHVIFGLIFLLCVKIVVFCELW